MACGCGSFILKTTGMPVELLRSHIELTNSHDLIEIDIHRLEEELLQCEN